jgi:IgA Peptidase M64
VSEYRRKLAVLHGGHSEANVRLVIIGDGYTQAELGRFHLDTEMAVQTILSTPPFGSMPIIVGRVDVASQESSAYRSVIPGRVATALGSRVDGHDPHLLLVNNERVMEEVCAALPAHWQDHKILVLVNAPEIFGGSGAVLSGAGRHASGIAVVSNANGNVTLMHELGHAFGLADESPGSAVMKDAPNVATNLERLPGFWRDRLTPDVKLPTMGSDRDVVGVFGAHAGRARSDLAHYRPQYSCIMKTASALDRYCKVCVDWIKTSPMARAQHLEAA